MDKPIVQDFDLDVNNFSETDYCDFEEIPADYDPSKPLLDTKPLKPVFDLSHYTAYVSTPANACMTSTRLFIKDGKILTIQLPCNDRTNCHYCRTNYIKRILSDLGEQPKFFQYVTDEKWHAWTVYFNRNRDSHDRYWRIPMDANGYVVLTTLERKGVVPVDDQERKVTGWINEHYETQSLIDPETHKRLKRLISHSYKVRECEQCSNELGKRDKACPVCGFPCKRKFKSDFITDPINVSPEEIERVLKDLGLERQKRSISKTRKGVEIEQHSKPVWKVKPSVLEACGMTAKQYLEEVVHKTLANMQRDNRKCVNL